MAQDNGNPAAGAPSPAERSSRYPRHGLREAEAFARATFDLGPYHVQQEEVASKVGYKGVANGAYKARRASARYFGLVDYRGDDFISVTPDWVRVFHEEDDNQLSAARAQAALAPELYRQLFELYRDKMLPRIDRLSRDLVLNTSLNIRKDAAEVAAQTFLDTMAFAGLVDGKGFLRERDLTAPSSISDEDALRERSDTLVGPLSGRESAAARAPEPMASTGNQPTQVLGLGGEPADQAYDRLEIRLPRGRKVYLLIPAPGILSSDDKQRLKGYIDLILEDED